MNGPGERISVYPKDKQLVGQKLEIMLSHHRIIWTYKSIPAASAPLVLSIRRQ
jgi:hypothetical protein